MFKHLCIILACAVLGGCGQKGPSPELLEKEAELERMQTEWVSLQQDSSARIKDLENDNHDIALRLTQEFDQHEKLIQLLRNQVDNLREENRKLLLENARNTTQPAPPPIPPTPPAFEHLDAAVEIAEAPSPTFSIKVTNIAGRKVITGSHSVKEFVPSGETYKDKFGRVREEGDWIDKPVNHYAYEVVFSLLNETDRTIKVTARAGGSSENMTLGPGETHINAKLVAAKGSGLWILSDGKSRQFDVKYQD